jgi:hypothetical protein
LEAPVKESGRGVLRLVGGAGDSGGELVASVVPYIEAGLNGEEVREAHARWQATLKVKGNAEQFAEFLAET